MVIKEREKQAKPRIIGEGVKLIFMYMDRKNNQIKRK